MAVTPKQLIRLSERQKIKIADLEKKIDLELRRRFMPEMDKVQIELPYPVTAIEGYHLEKKYEAAGWIHPIVEFYEGNMCVLVMYHNLDKKGE